MINFAAILKAFDAFVVVREAVRHLKGAGPPAETRLTAAAQMPAGQLEARLASVVVAALKEAFDRDHARLELERAQLDEQRRRAEEALRADQRRQAADREVGRLRLIAGTSLGGWIAAVAMVLVRLDTASAVSRGVSAAAWVLLLAALGASFVAQGRVSASVSDPRSPVHAGAAGGAALWLLIAGLAFAAGGLLL